MENIYFFSELECFVHSSLDFSTKCFDGRRKGSMLETFSAPFGPTNH